MKHSASKPVWIPALLAAGGLALMCAARPIAEWMPGPKITIYSANFLFWLSACLALPAYAVYRQLAPRSIMRLCLALTVFMLCMFPRYVNDYQWMTQRSLTTLGAAALLCGLLCLAPAQKLLTRLTQGMERVARLPAWLFIGTLYITFFLLCVFLEDYLFAHFPVYTDSIAQYVHARIMAQGKLYEPAHALSDFFYIPMSVTADGKLYSQYQPMHVFLLTLGQLAGAPWVVNPAIGALTLVALYVLARRIAGERTARIAALLMLFSPFIVILSSEYMNHATALLFGTLFLLSFTFMLDNAQREHTRQAGYWALAAGLALSAVILTRPLSAVGLSLPYLAYLGWLFLKDARSYIIPCLVLGFTGLACIVFQAWYNLQLTGSMFIFPYAKYSTDNIPRLDEGHSLWRAMLKGEDEWLRMNNMLFEWSVPCTLFVLLACLLPLANRHQRLLLIMPFSYTLANFFNPFRNIVFGPRYLYELTPALLIFTAIGLRRLPALLAFLRFPAGRKPAYGAIALTLCAIYATCWHYRMPDLIRSYKNNFFDNHPEFYYSLMEQAKKPALVFIEQVKRSDDDKGRYRRVAHDNPPQDQLPVIFALDMGPERNPDLIKYYPERTPYLERGGKLYPIDTKTFTSNAPRDEAK